ncbi:M20 aminoacylase family protein [Robbsia sp. KACC 23696]|uniref:M20 aminoacylase family protein n=1 Tax=Robbsia sp. KACC 23696 TaxID=3149231 RepID=UPI00325B62CE
MPHNTHDFCTVDDTADLAAELAGLRQRLHRHPELGFAEHQTADCVADALTSWGYDVTRGIAGTGMVATLRSGTSTRAIAIRADMDALRITETTGLPYASTHAGVMHACGHDGHTTMALGAARQLARTRRFDGIVHLVFQPAEEVGGNASGASRMIAEGLFERFPCDAIFGLHNHPGYPAGTFMFRSGAFMAASDVAEITIQGRGGHAARPHQSIDPIVVASTLVLALQGVVSRNIDPLSMAVITVGAFHAGDAPNVIPGTATLRLSIRSMDPGVREQLAQRIRALAESIAHGHGATADVRYTHGYPVLINSAAETALAEAVARELVGDAQVVSPLAPITGSEDFACYLQHKPGCFLRIGNGEEGAMLHNGAYDFNDANLTIGAAYWARLVERFLAKAL